MANALVHLHSTGNAVDDAMMAHTLPVGGEHIEFFGDFLWEQAVKSRARKRLSALPEHSRLNYSLYVHGNGY